MSGAIQIVTGQIGAPIAALGAAVNQAGAVINQAGALVTGALAGAPGAVVNGLLGEADALTGGAVGAVAGVLGALTGGAYAIGAGAAHGLGPWAMRLQPASWQGLPFAVRSSQVRRGRRVAVHEYPFRDTVWVEDLGRGVRMISFSGFLIGDDVYAQRDAMVAATETAGPGTLVHPSLGLVTANLIEFAAGERADLGRVVELEFSFIQGGQDQPVYPTTAASTQSQVAAAASTALAAIAGDFNNSIAGALQYGESVAQGALGQVLSFGSTALGPPGALAALASQGIALPSGLVSSALSTAAAGATGLVNDAGLASGMVSGLAGNFGRFVGDGLTSVLPDTATIEGQMDALADARGQVSGAISDAMATANSALSQLPAAMNTAMSALQNVTFSPATQIRLLTQVAGGG